MSESNFQIYSGNPRKESVADMGGESSQAEKKEIKISVRNLVEFVLKGGDIDNRRMGAAGKEAMQAGSRIHRKLQKRMGAGYRAEVAMKHVVEEEKYRIVVEGRADGILESQGAVAIDEIKGMYLDLNRLEEPIAVHLAQARCYGYFYCCDQDLQHIQIQVTYCNLETEEIRRFVQEETVEELECWFRGLIHEYIKWAEYLYHHGLWRDQSIRDLEFPFPYREGQRDLVTSVYKAFSRKCNLFVQAPTGVGKTLSTVFPAIKAMGEGRGEKLFYLTAKSVTRNVAEEAFAILRRQNLHFKAVTITAKEKLCFLEKTECNPEKCLYAAGHYDRVNDAVFEIIQEEFLITRDMVLEYAQKHRICPFEFCLDISSWVDGIICDYNYVFDPNVRLKRYFAEGVTGDYLFLVDEAHNLVPRAREMFSASIEKEEVLLIKRIVKQKSPRLSKTLERCNKTMLEMKRECEDWQLLSGIAGLANSLMEVFGELEPFLEEEPEFEDRELVLDFYFCLRDFLNMFDRLDDHYRIYSCLNHDGRFTVRLFCINPAKNLKESLDKGRSTIFFSATMLPIRYYKELLSGNQEDYAVYVKSPFPAENRLILIASDVSSRYTRRNRGEYQKVVSYIKDMAKARTGNYLVFLPSYQYLEQVAGILREETDLFCLVQNQSMAEEERDQFLLEFEQERDQSMVALCVMGGIFSEGIDLKEERLVGTAIVGTGLPMVCLEQEVLKGYFDDQGKTGFDFAYQYPGMNKVLQAAGRVIRTASDRGIILLLDDRFLKTEYQELFPQEWQEYGITTRHNAGEWMRRFWEKKLT